MEKYDLMIIGSGPGGASCANEAGKTGLSVAVIEKLEAGGTCLNRGCIPTKAMLHAAEIFSDRKKHSAWFANGEEDKINFSSVCEYRENTIAVLQKDVLSGFQKNHIRFYHAEGKISSVSDEGVTVLLSDQTVLSAANVILASGSHVFKLPVPGADLPNVLTSDEFLSMRRLPGSVVIVGGGVIGCEFACFLNGFGIPVTVIEFLPRILSGMSREISQNLKMILKKRGVVFYEDSSLLRVEQENENQLKCFFRKNGENDAENSVMAETVLMAAGRKTDIQNLFTEKFLSEGKIPETDRGRIKVGEDFRTSLQHVYAIGDIVPGPQLAHKAAAEGKHAVRAIALSSGKAFREDSCDLSLIPSCVYTDPEIASAGLTESAAKEQGISVKCGKTLTGANSKSVITGEEHGFLKFVSEESTGILIGAEFMCARASDMIGEASLAIVNRLTVTDCLKSVRAHPTYEEAMTEALEKML